jgi:hypothetical protein
MSNAPAKHSLLERTYFRYIIRQLSFQKPQTEEEVNIINQDENKRIKRLTVKYVLWSAIIAIIGVNLYYIPHYIFPAFFEKILWRFSLLGFDIKIVIISLFYGLILSYFEVVILVILNIRAIKNLTLICGFPRKGDPDYENQIFDLVTLGMERNDKRIKEFRINPYKGTSRFAIFLFWIYVNVKQNLSNKLAKFLVRVLVGRYVIRAVVDMVGIPVYACWNAYGTLKVIRNARLRIAAPRYIEQFSNYMHTRNANNERYTGFLLHSLQFIANAKYNYHFSHFLLAKKMLVKFGLEIKIDPLDADKYLLKYRELDESTKKDLLNTLIIGMILDGHFSRREQKMLQQLDPDLMKPEIIKEIRTQAFNIRKNNQIKFIF